MQKSLYEILGVESTATKEEIKQAYRKKAKESHPDKGGNKEEMTNLSIAYRILSNDAKRAKYDETGSIEAEVDFNSKFMSTISQFLLPMIDRISDLDSTDLIELLKHNITNTLKNTEKSKSEVLNKIKSYENVRKRVKSKKNNLILQVLDNQINGLNQSLGAHDVDIDFLRECIETLNDYSYETENFNYLFINAATAI